MKSNLKFLKIKDQQEVDAFGKCSYDKKFGYYSSKILVKKGFYYCPNEPNLFRNDINMDNFYMGKI